jgi:hypothetical protein
MPILTTSQRVDLKKLVEKDKGFSPLNSNYVSNVTISRAMSRGEQLKLKNCNYYFNNLFQLLH